jgi:hypothetical protein
MMGEVNEEGERANERTNQTMSSGLRRIESTNDFTIDQGEATKEDSEDFSIF